MEVFQEQAMRILSGVVIHVFWLWVLIIAFVVGTIALFVADRPIRGILLALIPAAMIVWFISALMQPLAPERVDYYEIKTVTWPDGTSSQMWTCGGTHHSVTGRFSKTVDPEKWHIRRTTWRSVYNNLSFSGCGPTQQEPAFYLVEKEKCTVSPQDAKTTPGQK